MIEFVQRRPLLITIVGVLIFVLVSGSFPIVPETKQAVDRPLRQAGADCSTATRSDGRSAAPAPASAGANSLRRRSRWIDKRVQDVDMQRQQVISTDQRRLQVDAFARYRIVDPLLMYIRAGNEKRLTEQLRPILGQKSATSLAGSNSPASVARAAGNHGQRPRPR